MTDLEWQTPDKVILLIRHDCSQTVPTTKQRSFNTKYTT